MPTFRDAEQLYQVMNATFRRARDEPGIAAALRAGDLVVRFR